MAKAKDKVVYYKVLGANGQSIHGGNLKWDLPKAKKPGKWHKVSGKVVVCSNGLHLTTEPARWFTTPDCKVFVADGRGDASKEGDKTAFAEARLMRAITSAADLAKIGILTGALSGEFTNSSSVTAYDSSSVKAYGSSSVTACDSSSVTAYDSSSVKAYGSSSVTACGSSSVTACDSSSVTAYDSSSVTAYDLSSVTACGSSVVTRFDRRCKVTLTDLAILIDRSIYGVVTTYKAGDVIPN